MCLWSKLLSYIVRDAILAILHLCFFCFLIISSPLFPTNHGIEKFVRGVEGGFCVSGKSDETEVLRKH